MLFGDFGEKFFILEVLTYFDPFYPSWKESNILVKISPQELKFLQYHIFEWRIRKN
jgi:hypothetical protein